MPRSIQSVFSLLSLFKLDDVGGMVERRVGVRPAAVVKGAIAIDRSKDAPLLGAVIDLFTECCLKWTVSCPRKDDDVTRNHVLGSESLDVGTRSVRARRPWFLHLIVF